MGQRSPKLAARALNNRIATMVLMARSRAALTQAELAERVGTRQPVIARFEDPHYEGHSLSMLQRIATALNLSVEVRLVSKPKPLRNAAGGTSGRGARR